MKLRLITPAIALFHLVLLSNFAYAIGDSAGGCGLEGSPLEVAAISGTPGKLITQIDHAIVTKHDYEEKHRDYLVNSNWNKPSEWIEQKSIEQPIESQRTVFINMWSGCNNIHLLELAAAGGNQLTAQYLLNAGADPNIFSAGNTIFMRCANLREDRKRLSINDVPPITRLKKDIDGKFAVYKLLLTRGGDLNKLNYSGLSALHLCRDPETIAFYLQNGANPNRPAKGDRTNNQNNKDLISMPVLDFHLTRIVNDYDLMRETDFSILEKLLPSIKNKTLKRETLSHICYMCSDPEKAATCKRLSKLIDVPDKDIFRSIEHGEKNDVAIEKCKNYRSKQP